MVTGVVPSSPRFLPQFFIAHRVQQSHCSSIFHRVLRTHALALSASQFVHKIKSQRIYTSMHSAGLELTKLTYNRLEDNLIRHRGDRLPLQLDGFIAIWHAYNPQHAIDSAAGLSQSSYATLSPSSLHAVSDRFHHLEDFGGGFKLQDQVYDFRDHLWRVRYSDQNYEELNHREVEQLQS